MSSAVAQHFVSGFGHDRRTLTVAAPAPDYETGDRRYFSDEGASAGWRIRPILSSDLVEGLSYSPGARLLVRYWPALGATIRAAVWLPPEVRDRPRQGVLCAARRLHARGSDFLPLVALANRRDAERSVHPALQKVDQGKRFCITFI